MKRVFFTSLALFAIFGEGIRAQGVALSDLVERSSVSQGVSLRDLVDRGAVFSPSIWIWPNILARKVIFVCWENPSPRYVEKMELVKSAIESSWAKHSALEFAGWGGCSVASRGIRIAIRDDQPETKKLGRFLDGRRNGMILNFEFNNWTPACTTGSHDGWIADLAVHEFGHAIALTHEHNRDDTPKHCTAGRQGTDPDNILTDWDPESEMNYCFCDGDAELSPGDIESVQVLYGRSG